MSDKTGIEWTDATWNPIRGCSRVSQGCVNCYAEKVAARFSGVGQPYEGLVNKHGTWNGSIKFVGHALDQPLRWKRPRRIFVNSMSDLFHENVTDDQIDRIFAVMALSPQHTFQILTKRPERMLAWATHDEHGRWGYVDGRARQIWREYSGKEFPVGKMLPFQPLPNVWLGVSVESQATANERIPLLLRTPAAVRFLSCEPLLRPMSLESSLGGIKWIGGQRGCDGEHHGHGETPDCPTTLHHHHDDRCQKGIDWVIAGGESGRGARPMHPDWARSLRDQCKEAGVSFFFKQWGAWRPAEPPKESTNKPAIWLLPDGYAAKDYAEFRARKMSASMQAMWNVGKAAAGRLLDGHEHSEYPA